MGSQQISFETWNLEVMMKTHLYEHIPWTCSDGPHECREEVESS